MPTMDGNRLYFKFPECSTPNGPFNVCDPCMENLRKKLDDASPGRYDRLYDESQRIAFSIDRPIPFSRNQAIEIVNLVANRNFLQVAYSMNVLPELVKKTKLRNRLLHKPIPFCLAKEDSERTLAESDKACTSEPASHDARTTLAQSSTCTSDFLQ